MPEKLENEKIMDESKKKQDLEKRFQETHNRIIETLKERKQFEKEYMVVIKKQKKYWNDRLKETDPKIR